MIQRETRHLITQDTKSYKKNTIQNTTERKLHYIKHQIQ